MGREAEEDDDSEQATRLERDWQERPFARTFDLIASEYQYTDDEILDLTLTRMRQMRDVIAIRQRAEWRRKVALEELKVRHLASSTHGAAGNKKGASSAAKITLQGPEDEEKQAKKRIPNIRAVNMVFSRDPLYPVYSDEDIEEQITKMRAEGRL